MNIIKKYLIPTGSILLGMLAVNNVVQADQSILDDLIVDGSLCVGMDCVNGENFNFDTIRLKENNLRIKFIDTSSSASFPTGDWEITINDSANGGVNRFSIKDIDSNRIPFTVVQGARDNSIYVKSNGFVGLGTSTPEVNLHVVEANTPTLRLEQTQAAGFAAQAWDVGGNETNFFIRDVTGGSRIPFRIVPNAPNASIYVAADGDIGFQSTTPDGILDIAHPSNINNHAFFISPVANVGVNIDNGFLPNALFEVQTTGGISRFSVVADGDVGIGTATPKGRFEVKSNDAAKTYLNVDASGDVGIGTAGPIGRFEVKSTDAATSYFGIDATGNVGIGTNAPVGRFEVRGTNPDTSTESSYFDIDASGNVRIGPKEPVDSNATFAAIDPNATLTGRFGVRNLTGDFELLTLSDTGKLVAKDDVCTMKGGTETCLSTAGGSGTGGSSSNTWAPWDITDNSNVLSFAYSGGSTLLTLNQNGDLSASSSVSTSSVNTTSLTATGDVSATNVSATNVSATTLAATGDVSASSVTLSRWAIEPQAGRSDESLVFKYDQNIMFTLDNNGKLIVAGDSCGTGGVDCVSSSKYLKDIYSLVDSTDILEKVSSLAISLWSYKDDEDSVLHIGPMAEDFQETFGLNGDITDKIAIVDGLGVALTSIQALHSEIKQKDLEIAQLKQDIVEIKQMLQQH